MTVALNKYFSSWWGKLLPIPFFSTFPLQWSPESISGSTLEQCCWVLLFFLIRTSVGIGPNIWNVLGEWTYLQCSHFPATWHALPYTDGIIFSVELTVFFSHNCWIFFIAAVSRCYFFFFNLLLLWVESFFPIMDTNCSLLLCRKMRDIKIFTSGLPWRSSG